MFYVYILYSARAQKYYVGYSDDVARRLSEHNEISDHSFTSKYRPWTLKALFEVGPDRGVAMRVEKHIKQQKSCQYIEAIIQRGSIDRILARYCSAGSSGPDVHRD